MDCDYFVVKYLEVLKIKTIRNRLTTNIDIFVKFQCFCSWQFLAGIFDFPYFILFLYFRIYFQLCDSNPSFRTKLLNINNCTIVHNDSLIMNVVYFNVWCDGIPYALNESWHYSLICSNRMCECAPWWWSKLWWVYFGLGTFNRANSMNNGNWSTFYAPN